MKNGTDILLYRRLGLHTSVESEIGDVVVPWVFADEESEYRALRHEAGLIDLSVSGLFAVEGAGAVELLQTLFARDVSYLSYETSTMGLFLDEEGRPIDITTVYRVVDGYQLESSPGNAGRLRQHLEAHAGDDVEIRDLREHVSVIGIEGPETWSAIDSVVDEVVSGLPFQGVRPVTIGGVEATVSRTGVTGEFGVKVLCDHDLATEVWKRLADAVRPVGYGAVETAMCEVRQPILHREATDGSTAVAAGFTWLVDLEKDAFVGRDAVVEELEAPRTHGTVCFVSDCPSVPSGTPVSTAKQEVGEVVHSVLTPALDATCGIARVKAEVAASGLVLALDLESGREIMKTVSSPVVVPTSWKLISFDTVGDFAGQDLDSVG